MSRLIISCEALTPSWPESQRAKARRIGIGLALFPRLGLLGTIATIMSLTRPIFTLFGHGFSWRYALSPVGPTDRTTPHTESGRA